MEEPLTVKQILKKENSNTYLFRKMIYMILGLLTMLIGAAIVVAGASMVVIGISSSLN